MQEAFLLQKITLYNKYDEYFQEFLINKDINVETYKEIKFDKSLEKMLNIEYWFSIIRKISLIQKIKNLYRKKL